MKVVHLIHKGKDDNALCGHKLDYTKHKGDQGWCTLHLIRKYARNNPPDADPSKEFWRVRTPWKWCEECLTSSDYALFVLGDLP